MQKISVGYIGNAILNLFIFILLLVVYSYISNLEAIGCACSVHPNRDFIKIFSIVAFVALIFIGFVPTSLVDETFGNTVAILFVFIKLVFYIICMVYFYMIIDYTRFLVNEKCKCSEDIRRELIMAGSIIEIILMFISLLVIIILPIVVNSVVHITRNMDHFEKEINQDMKSPYKSLKRLPSDLKKATKIPSKSMSKSFQKVKVIIRD